MPGKNQRISIALGLVTIDACAAALVRKHAFWASVAADGVIIISGPRNGSVDSTHQLLQSPVRRMRGWEVDVNGNPQGGNVQYVADTRDNALPNHAIMRVTERVKPLTSMRLHENRSALNTLANLMSKALSDDAHLGGLNETVPNTIRQQEAWPSLTFSVLEMLGTSIAPHYSRSDNPILTLILLTIVFVLVGLIIAVLFPERRRDVVDQMIACCRLFTQRDVSREPRRANRQKPTAINDFLKKFEIREKLGEGAFGVVHAVYSRQEGKTFAAKMIDVMGSDSQLIREEVAILKRVQHASLTACCLYDYHDQCFFYLVMPLYSGGDLSGALSDYIESRGLLPERLFAKLFEQMTTGVAFVQSRQVVHRDIKPENFLLASSSLDDPSNRVVVADFGMSAVLDDGAFLDEVCGTPVFMSPELFAGKYDFKVDVFALGLTAYVLLAGAFAFSTEDEITTWATSSDPPPMPPSISPVAQAIFEKSLARDASQRASAKELEKLATSLIGTSSGPELEIKRRESMKALTLKKALGIGGDEIQENKGDRRHRMICELIRAHKGTIANYAGGSKISSAVLEARPFEIKKGRRNQKVSCFDFWSRENCVNKRVSGIEDADLEPLPVVTEALPSDVKLLDDVLTKYSVDRGSWGQGKTKALTDLVKECKGGLCFLTENEKRLERVVEVVALVVTNHEGKILHQLPLVPKAALGKASAVLTAFTQPRLPGHKMEAWETVHETADRVLDMLKMSAQDVDLNFDVPMRVVKGESTSYPGLTTVYKKHMIEVSMREDDCNPDQLAVWGLPGSNKFVTKSMNGALNWGWLSRKEAEQIGTLDEADVGLAMRYAEVLPVKSKEISVDQIKNMLRKTNANVDGMSQFALEELAEQVGTGEVDLVEEEQPDGTRSLKRKVTVTMLRLAHQDGSILLEVSKSADGGTSWNDTNWLPATKQHTFENHFYVARRLLTSRFMLAEGRWQMDNDKGCCISEERESDKLRGLPTIYIKNIVAARLC